MSELQGSGAAALQTSGLGRRYGRHWALRDCSLSLPQGHVIGLVGPNGAGKTTLLHMAVGLLAPTAGQISVLGAAPRDPAVRSRVAFVAQDKPLYPRFTVAETLRMGGWLNRGFDAELATGHIERLGIPLSRRVARLSGGQHAQVALALAVGTRPDLLLLDEPVANLDPLARREFMRVLMEEVAATGMSVLLSSHLIEDLERTCDYFVLMSHSRVQLSQSSDDLLATHRLVTGPRERMLSVEEGHTVVQAACAGRQATMLIRTGGRVRDPALTVRPVTIGELVLAYMSQPDATAPPALSAVPAVTEVSR